MVAVGGVARRGGGALVGRFQFGVGGGEWAVAVVVVVMVVGVLGRGLGLAAGCGGGGGRGHASWRRFGGGVGEALLFALLLLAVLLVAAVGRAARALLVRPRAVLLVHWRCKRKWVHSLSILLYGR